MDTHWPEYCGVMESHRSGLRGILFCMCRGGSARSQRLSVSTERSGCRLTIYISASRPIAGHTLARRSAVMAGQVSRQMRKMMRSGGPVSSCLRQHQPSPAESVVCVCGVVLIRPVSADTQHTVVTVKRGPRSCSAPVSPREMDSHGHKGVSYLNISSARFLFLHPVVSELF